MRKLYVALAMAIFTVGLSSIAASEEAALLQEDRYAPMRLGVPGTLGGHPVLAVLTEDNFVCMMPGEKRLVLQSPQPTLEDALRDFSRERIKEELQELNLTEYAQWGWTIVGPGATQEQLVSQFEQSYRFFKAHGCITLGLPKTTSSATGAEGSEAECPLQPSGEAKCSFPFPGFAIIPNADAGAFTNANAQSVYLVAPTLGNNQQPKFQCHWTVPPLFECGWTGPYSAFLNNVLTDKDYKLQAGFLFQRNFLLTKTEGQVVWTDDAHGLQSQPFPIAYSSGHHYWTTITYTSGIWWMCALDTQDTATYACEDASQPDIGTYLKWDRVKTSIFAENWNKNSDWYNGFSTNGLPEWSAYGAEIYIGGIGQQWLLHDTLTFDACQNAWLPENAIVDSLVKGGTAHFQTKGIPLYCEGTGVPVITQVNFPSAITGDGVLVPGSVQFTDSNAGVNWAQFDVVADTCGGCLIPFGFDPGVSNLTEGEFGFDIWCTTETGFSWTMKVTLKDVEGHVSGPVTFPIECVPPPIARSLGTAFETEDQGGGGF